jgi:hypothetical protein
MNKDAAAARREYARKYREQNRERLNEKHKQWREKPENKKKIKMYQETYWSKKAQDL